MGEESFYGAILTSKDNTVSLQLVEKTGQYPRAQKLIVKQILLGAEAKENEFNVVEVEVDSLKIPIAVLKVGETRALTPNIEFYDTPVSFKLIQGEGPVHINGQKISDDFEMLNWQGEESDEEGMESDELDEEEEVQPQKKKSIENNSDGKNTKHKK